VLMWDGASPTWVTRGWKVFLLAAFRRVKACIFRVVPVV